MDYLLGKKGIKEIHRLCSAKTLFAFDFDGTLSKIYSHPHGARIADKTHQLLCRLNEVAHLAIISGRYTADLKSHLGFAPQYLVGNHGASGLSLKKSMGLSARHTCRVWKKQILEFLEELIISGIELEDNRFTLSIHFRNVRSKRGIKKAIMKKVLQLSPPPHIVTGKSVINIIPKGFPNKGDAFKKLLKLSDAKSAFYIGDDDTDEDIFALFMPKVLTARVGYNNKSRARFYLRRQSEVNKFLQLILGII